MLFDVGNLFVIAGGGSGGPPGLLGELWVEYDCELITPELNSSNLTLDGAAQWSRDSQILNESATTIVWSMGPHMDFYEVAASGPDPYQWSMDGPKKTLNMPVVETTVPSITNLPVNSTPDTIYWYPGIDRSTAATVVDFFLGFVPRANSSYVMTGILDAAAAAGISAFDIGFSSANGSTTFTLIDKVTDNTTKKVVATYQVDVGLTGNTSATVIYPVTQFTVAAASVVGFTYTWFIRYLQPQSTEIIPAFELASHVRPAHSFASISQREPSGEGVRPNQVERQCVVEGSSPNRSASCCTSCTTCLRHI